MAREALLRHQGSLVGGGGEHIEEGGCAGGRPAERACDVATFGPR